MKRNILVARIVLIICIHYWRRKFGSMVSGVQKPHHKALHCITSDCISFLLSLPHCAGVVHKVVLVLIRFNLEFGNNLNSLLCRCCARSGLPPAARPEPGVIPGEKGTGGPAPVTHLVLNCLNKLV